MREILFRGKRVDNGEWVYGNFCMDAVEQISGLFCVDGFIRRYETETNHMEMFEVDRETVGQYTGLTDKNGKKIFEGDIVHAVYSHDYVGIPDTDFGNLIVWFDGTYYGGARYQMDIIGGVGNRVFSVGLRNGVEIIGNIHDNPELIGGC